MKKIINKFKRGFTIVELVIVIAVIAILAAVLIPTLSNVLNSAEESADMQTVYHLNQILSSYSTVGDGAETISEAIEQADENGYNVSKLTPTSDGDILWDSESNRFLLVSSSGEVLYSDSTTKIDEIVSGTIYPNLWKIVSSSSEVTSYYSLYYSANYSGTLTDITITDVGVDVSAYTTNKVNITYNGSKTDSEDIIVINGNGGTVALNDEGHDTIKLYGTASSVTANKVYISSLHVYAKITSTIYIAEGHLVIEVGSTVSTVYASSSSVSVTNLSSNSITVGTTTGVSITVSGNISEEDITDETELNYFAGGFGTEASPYLIETETQFQKIVNGTSSSAKKYYKLLNNITLTAATATYDSGWYTWYHTPSSSTMFIVLDGDGYTITLNDDVEEMCDSTKKIYNMNSAFSMLYYSTIKNVTFSFKASSGQQAIRAASGSSSNPVTLDNVITEGTLTVSGNCGSFITYGYNYITMKNCTNRTNMTGSGVSTDYNAAFIGYTYNNNPNFTFENCVNEANIVCGRAGMFVGNVNASTGLTLTITNCSNKGIIRSTYVDSSYTPYYYWSIGDSNIKSITIDGTTYAYSEVPSMSNTYNGPADIMTLTLDEDGYYVITKSNQSSVATYKIIIGLYVNYSNGTNRYYITVEVDPSELSSGSYTSSVANLQFMDLATYLKKTGKSSFKETDSNVTAIGNGYIVTVDSVDYYLINNAEYSLGSGVANIGMASVSVFDADGNMLSSAAYSKNS